MTNRDGRAQDPYDPGYVAQLFDAMAGSYERVNELTSFGFSRRWRRRAVDWLAPAPGDTVLDAMTGMGEGWRHLARRIGPTGRIIAIDSSPCMLARAAERQLGPGAPMVEPLLRDALDAGIADGSLDGLLCLFGIKTLSDTQRDRFAAGIARMLRPGGRFSLIEVSVPPWRVLRVPYMAYLRHAVPLVGRLFLGEPEPYRTLAGYTSRFGDCGDMARSLRAAGLEVEPMSAFFGCATGVRGRRRP
jgi:demethylmenaquinone methyltransferase/2-methoxy-6-polyprenyl-1,4-benzoquinol methylase